MRRDLQNISNILLIRLRSLGDAILTLPLIEALHRWRPEIRPSVLIEAPFAPVFLHHPAVRETLVLQRGTAKGNGWTRFRAVAEIRKRHYPAVLNLHGGTTSMMFTGTSGAQLRIGQEGHRHSWIYTTRIPPSTGIWGRPSLHTVEHQLSLLRWLDIPIDTSRSTLHIDERSRSGIGDRLTRAGISEFVLIQPTATLPTKQWPAARFAGLGDWILKNCGIPVIFTAAAHERYLLDEIQRTALSRHTYWADLPLMDLFALIERCRLFAGCDSGPAHAAAALKRPLVVVWGSSNLQAWHPWETNYEAVGSNLPCIPCPGYECSVFGEPRCILEVSLPRVAEACARMLAKPSA